LNIDNHTGQLLSIADKLLEKECIDECLDVCNEIEQLIKDGKEAGVSFSNENGIVMRLANIKRSLNLLMLPVVRKKITKK